MIRADWQDGICTLTINRPDKANALNREMLLDLAGHVKQAKAAKAIILTGSGKVFSAGADLDAAKAGLATDGAWEKLSGAIAAAPTLTIAALNGTVAGGALGMVLACDLRIAVPSAKFFYPVMKLGFLPQPSDPLRMSALIGPSRAKMILMAGQKIDAAKAQEWGLVDQLSSAETLLDEAKSLAADAQSADFSHVAVIKHMFGAGIGAQ